MDMDEKKVRDIAKEEAQKIMMRNYRAGNPLVPPHEHSENDNLRIQEKNIIKNSKTNVFITADSGGGGGSITLTKLPVNPSAVSFFGIATYDSGSGVTKKATVTGRAELGNCFSQITSVLYSPVESKVLYSTNLFLVDYTGISYISGNPKTYSAFNVIVPSFHVETDNTSFASVQLPDNTFPVLTTIPSWGDNFITIKFVISSGWILAGNFIIT